MSPTLATTAHDAAERADSHSWKNIFHKTLYTQTTKRHADTTKGRCRQLNHTPHFTHVYTQKELRTKPYYLLRTSNYFIMPRRRYAAECTKKTSSVFFILSTSEREKSPCPGGLIFQVPKAWFFNTSVFRPLPHIIRYAPHVSHQHHGIAPTVSPTTHFSAGTRQHYRNRE